MKAKFWRFLYKLHRYTGLLSAVVFLMLAVTGIALNHTDDLKLDQKMIKSSLLLDWYGIALPSHVLSFSTVNHQITQLDQHVYFNGALLTNDEKPLKGLVETDDFMVAAFSNRLVLLSHQGEVIERMPIREIERIGLNQQQFVVIESAKGVRVSDDGLLSWQPSFSPSIQWSSNSQPSSLLLKVIKDNFRSSILPLERVLLDLHSGRFFGIAGVIVVDISGVLLIVLSLSGCAIWLKHKIRRLKNRGS